MNLIGLDPNKHKIIHPSGCKTTDVVDNLALFLLVVNATPASAMIKYDT